MTHDEKQKAVIEAFNRLILRRLPRDKDDYAIPMREDGTFDEDDGPFDPWDLFPIYGSYSEEFDLCAIDVLTELNDGCRVRTDLGAYMFREILCVMGLCEYWSSPRTCFPVEAFSSILPKLIEMWKEYSRIQWHS
jgi:hypothetical protein